MKEYRALRANHSLLEICRTPELAVEVTLQPLRAFDLDAAIVFADLLLPLEPMGAPFRFMAGEGPVIEQPVRSESDIHRLHDFDIEAGLGFVLEAIRILRRILDGKTPLIGFAGAPFTLASYLIEGGKSQHYLRTKRLMYERPELWHLLASKLSQMTLEFMTAQVRAGAQALQLFDSWVGVLSPTDYQRYAMPHVHHILSGLADCGVPLIHFGTGTHALLELQRHAGGTVIGIDWRTPLGEASLRLGSEVALQGNLDPALLFAPKSVLKTALIEILAEGRKHPGYVFNLGHGILPETDPDMVRWLAETVHELGRYDAS